MGEVFGTTDVGTLTDDEEVILVEPEYFDWLLPLIIASPDNIVGELIFDVCSNKTRTDFLHNLWQIVHSHKNCKRQTNQPCTAQ